MQGRLGVTAPQRMVIRLAGRFPDATASELAALLHLDPGSLSSLLARLEEAGLLNRTADRHDRRRIRVSSHGVVVDSQGTRRRRSSPPSPPSSPRATPRISDASMRSHVGTGRTPCRTEGAWSCRRNAAPARSNRTDGGGI
ncbi:MAG: MarR family transcriptional regulator [Gemmatimonadetes bacterium]|nr:MarR family transcriptional regulator [Gemmatimonadota bacterium]